MVRAARGQSIVCLDDKAMIAAESALMRVCLSAQDRREPQTAFSRGKATLYQLGICSARSAIMLSCISLLPA